MAEVLSFRQRTYSAEVHRVTSCGFTFELSGTLYGHADFCVTEANGKHLTYTLDPDGLRRLASAALAVADDITKNCLYERDALLIG